MQKRTAILVLLFLISFFSLGNYCLAARENGVTVNFVDVELAGFAKFISEVTGKNFVFDDRIKGKVTVFAPSQLNKSEVYNLFLSVLELKGFTLLPVKANTFKIITTKEAREKGLRVSIDQQSVNDTYMARLVEVKYLSAETALGFLQPVISKDGYISVFAPGNLLLIIDSGLNIEKILSILELIDKPDVRSELEIIPLKNANAEEVSGLLNEIIKQQQKESRQAAEICRLIAAPRQNALVVFGDKSLRDKIKSFASLIDVPPVSAQSRVNVYLLENADAAELAKVLQDIVKSTQMTGIQPQTPKGPASFGAVDSITITSDKTTNALVIVATPADYQNLVQVIKKLDQRPRQVFVEAMIIEASVDELRDAGSKWRTTVRHNGEPVAITGFGSIDTDSVQSILTGLAGFTAGGMGNFLNVPVTKADGTRTNLSAPGFAALFSLDEFRGAVNVLSTPQILTSDNKEAEIIVGENVPFISKRESDPSRTLSVFSSIERKDVGINLKLTPHVTEGDYVKLDLYQEISAVKQDSQEILISVGPTTTKRATRTSVVVRNGETVVISGLMQERKEDGIQKIPLLGDIPYLGWLFKYKNSSKKKTNLLVFLTPQVVKDAAGLGELSRHKRDQFAMLSTNYVEDEILIKFAGFVSSEEAENFILSHGGQIVSYKRDTNSLIVKLPAGLSVQEALKKFGSFKEIEFVTPVFTSGQ